MTESTRTSLDLRRRRVPVAGLAVALAVMLTQAGAGAQAQVDRVQITWAQVDRGMGVIETSGSDESSFYQAIFGDSVKLSSAPASRLDQMLMTAIADVDRHCSLTEAQRAKLILAGRGDGKRFLDRVAAARRVFERLRNDPDGSEEILKAVKPLGLAFETGLYGEGSFFAKSLGSTLTPEQKGRRDRAILEKARFRYKAKVALVLASLDSVVGFSAEQHRRYFELILEATTPPRRSAGAFEANVVLWKIAGLPEDQVRAIFDDAQSQALVRIFRQARETEGFLRDNGYLD